MSWKTFRFFEFDEAKDPETLEPFSKLKVISYILLIFKPSPVLNHNCLLYSGLGHYLLFMWAWYDGVWR